MQPGDVAKRARLIILVLALALLVTVAVTLFLFSRTREQAASSPTLVYLFSYQIIALILGLVLVVLVVRWVLRPYRQMVAAAQGSPVRASAAKTESEFVVETFQALVDQLQAKEKELARLHAAERTRAERSERLSERLIANIPTGLVTVDAHGVVTMTNLQAMKIFGLANTAGLYATDKETGLFTPGIDCEKFFRHSRDMATLVRGCIQSGSSLRREEVEVVLPDGRIRTLGLSISPIADNAQNVEGALCLMTDITEVIELRERMKLQENLASLGEMAAGIAHEFKNSLATIHGYIQLMQTQVEGTSRIAHEARAGSATLEAALNEVRLLARVVTDFLNFARPQSLNLSPVDLRRLVDDCVEELRPMLEESAIQLTVDGEYAEIQADESLLRRALSNLIRNAAEAIDGQSARKLVSLWGSIDKGPDARYAHIRVSDTGKGIAREDLQRIFIPFFTTKSRGYGIGLAIVQKVLVAHGGDVVVEQSSSAGTTFHCRLALKPSTEAVKAG
jgi:signal transduction histidine kinase